MSLLSWVMQSRQERCYGYLLSSPDVAPVSRLCPLLHGPQFCLLPKLSVGPNGGRGSQVYDAPRPLRLLPPAGPQQLGTVPGGTPLERDGRYRTPGPAGGNEAWGSAAGAWGLLARQRHHL